MGEVGLVADLRLLKHEGLRGSDVSDSIIESDIARDPACGVNSRVGLQHDVCTVWAQGGGFSNRRSAL
jgi:hypothetical protein